MDDLKKQQIKNVDKAVSKVTDDFQEGLNRLNLDKLYQRKAYLEQSLLDPNKGDSTKAYYKLQIIDISEQIKEVSEKVDLSRDVDLECDEEWARKFFKDNPDILSPGQDAMIARNEALDKLEEELYGKD